MSCSVLVVYKSMSFVRHKRSASVRGLGRGDHVDESVKATEEEMVTKVMELVAIVQC